MACVMSLLYGAFVAPLITLQLIYVMALMFLMYAGIAFALSATARWDWLSLVAVTVFATFMWGRFGQSPSILAPTSNPAALSVSAQL